MNEAEFSIHTPTDNVLELDQAVLLYHGRSGSALATVHEVISVDGAPVISAGRAMIAQAARELAGALLQRAAHGGFLPETVLYLQGDLLVWWVPPARRHLAFRVDAEQAEASGVPRGRGAGRGIWRSAWTRSRPRHLADASAARRCRSRGWSSPPPATSGGCGP